MHFSSPDRLIILVGLLIGACLPVALTAEQDVVPTFVKEPIYSPNKASVTAVVSSSNADIILLDGGLEQGLRRGMMCKVLRGSRTVGELIIVESRIDHSAGLIVSLKSELYIQPGDSARIKTIQTS